MNVMRKIFVCTSLAIVCALSAARLAGVAPQDAGDQALLDSDTPIQRRLSRGEEHRYQLVLAAGEFARVVVEQEGIDVVVKVRDAADNPIDEFQGEIRHYGLEQVDVVAGGAGTYSLTIACRRGGRAGCVHDSPRQPSSCDQQ